jgi:hypothetical protein
LVQPAPVRSLGCGGRTEEARVTPREADSAAVKVAARHVREGAGGHVVTITLEGRSVMVALEVDPSEHARRSGIELGAVCSRRLLHALWELPANVIWPRSGLDAADLVAFSEARRGLVDNDGERLVRLYQPAGAVLAVGLRRANLFEAVKQVALFPGIFGRYAFASRRSRTDDQAAATASMLGVGTAIEQSAGLAVLSEAMSPQVGVPSVYRWWLAEVAYDVWLHESAH